MIPKNFFEYICQIGCAINLHSITNSRLIPGGQNLSKRQAVLFTSVDPTNKEHKYPDVIDLDAPRLAWYKQKVWKKHQNTVYWVDIKLAQKKGFKFYQTRSNAIILYDTLPAYCIPNAIMMGTGEIIYEKVNASPRPPPKISFKDNWMKELGSEVAGEGKKLPINPTKDQKSNRQNRETCFTIWFEVSYLAAKAPMKEQGDLFSSCVPVSVSRLDQDKDADENVDADHVRTKRPAESEQPSVCSHSAKK